MRNLTSVSFLHVYLSYSKGINNILKDVKDMLEDSDTRKEINEKIGNAINEFVPYDSGDLRESMDVQPDKIIWGHGLDYAHYQYEGKVYGKNYAIFSGGNVVGWYSLPGKGTKYPTGRTLGTPGNWLGWPFGYKTPGTKHHWIDAYLQNKNDTKRRTNISINSYLKRKCKELGFNK